MKWYVIALVLFVLCVIGSYFKGKADGHRPLVPPDTATRYLPAPVPKTPIPVKPVTATYDTLKYLKQIDSLLALKQSLEETLREVAEPYQVSAHDSLDIHGIKLTYSLSALAEPASRNLSVWLDSAVVNLPEKIITITVEKESPWWEIPVIFATGLFAGTTLGLVVGQAN